MSNVRSQKMIGYIDDQGTHETDLICIKEFDDLELYAIRRAKTHKETLELANAIQMETLAEDHKALFLGHPICFISKFQKDYAPTQQDNYEKLNYAYRLCLSVEISSKELKNSSLAEEASKLKEDLLKRKQEIKANFTVVSHNASVDLTQQEEKTGSPSQNRPATTASLSECTSSLFSPSATRSSVVSPTPRAQSAVLHLIDLDTDEEDDCSNLKRPGSAGTI